MLSNKNLDISDVKVKDLSPGDCHLWCFRVPDIVDEIFGSLNEAAQRSAQLINSGASRSEYITSSFVIQQLYTLYTSHKFCSASIAREQGGKPYWCLPCGRRSSIHFNVSHSRGYVVVVISLQPVGVDIERFQRLADKPESVDRLLSRVLTDSEQEFFGELPDSVRAEYIIRFWTAKEAVLKANGRGLSAGMNKVNVNLVEGGAVFCCDKKPASKEGGGDCGEVVGVVAPGLGVEECYHLNFPDVESGLCVALASVNKLNVSCYQQL